MWLRMFGYFQFTKWNLLLFSSYSGIEGDLVACVAMCSAVREKLCPALLHTYCAVDIVEGLDVDKEEFDKFSARYEHSVVKSRFKKRTPIAVSANLSLYTPSRLTECTGRIACITSTFGHSWQARKTRGRGEALLSCVSRLALPLSNPPFTQPTEWTTNMALRRWSVFDGL